MRSNKCTFTSMIQNYNNKDEFCEIFNINFITRISQVDKLLDKIRKVIRSISVR